MSACPDAPAPVPWRRPAPGHGCATTDAACSNARFADRCVTEVAQTGLLRFFPPTTHLMAEGAALETVCVGRRAYLLALGLKHAHRSLPDWAATWPPGTPPEAAVAPLLAGLPRTDVWCLEHGDALFFLVEPSAADAGHLRGVLARLLPSSLTALFSQRAAALTAAGLSIVVTRLAVALVSTSLVSIAAHVTSSYWDLLQRSQLLPPDMVQLLSGGSNRSFKQLLDLFSQLSFGVSSDLVSVITQLLLRVLLPCVISTLAWSLDFVRGVAEARRWALLESVVAVARENLHAGYALTLPVPFLTDVTHLVDRQLQSTKTALGLHGAPPPGRLDQRVVLELQKIAAPPAEGALLSQLSFRLANAIPALVTWAFGTTSGTAKILNLVTVVPLLLLDVRKQTRDAFTPETILMRAAQAPRAQEDMAAVRRAALLARADLRVALTAILARRGAAGALQADVACLYAAAVQRLKAALAAGTEEGFDLGFLDEPGGEAAAAKPADDASGLVREFGRAGAGAAAWPTLHEVEEAERVLARGPTHLPTLLAGVDTGAGFAAGPKSKVG